MSANTFGEIFRVTTFGESHGGAIGCVIDGCPPGIEISVSDIEPELARRATGQSKITSQRKEEDKVEILSGTFEGKTLGTPIAIIIYNKDANSKDYEYLKNKYRPSHADFTYEKKFGIRAWAGGGRASARETTARVIASAIAKKFLREKFNIEILGYVSSVKDIETDINPSEVTYDAIESNIVRCPDQKAAEKMIELITQMKEEGNSVGGIVTCVARNVPIGLGEPVFDKLDAELAKACLSIPATKGFEIGSGFAGTKMTGVEHNDAFIIKSAGKGSKNNEDKSQKSQTNHKSQDKVNTRQNTIGTRTNNSGGIQGGISNGENILMRVAFKPVSTIMQTQDSVNYKGEEIKLDNVKGRHDPCVLPRAVPIVEAMTALTIIDHYLRQNVQNK